MRVFLLKKLKVNKMVSESTISQITAKRGSKGSIRWLNLTAQLKPVGSGLDLMPLIDLLCIALLFSLLFTRLVITPGVQLSLSETELQMPQATQEVAVLTVQNEGMLLFDGGVYQVDSIEEAFLERMMRTKDKPVILLLKAGRLLPMQTLLDICSKAKSAGFVQIDLAAQRTEAAVELNVDNLNNSEAGYNFLKP
jgi:biopolymer transport protein ExbD